MPRNAEMKIEVVSADVALSGVAGRSLNVNGVSGKLRLDSDAKEVDVDSVSGNIELTGKAERGHLETVSGNMRARGLGGQIKFETVSGDIDAENGDYREINAGTVSGDINLRGKPTKDARIEVETMSGDVHLYLPADIVRALRATTFSRQHPQRLRQGQGRGARAGQQPRCDARQRRCAREPADIQRRYRGAAAVACQCRALCPSPLGGRSSPPNPPQISDA